MEKKASKDYFIMREKPVAEGDVPSRLPLGSISTDQLYTVKMPDGNKAIIFKQDNQLYAYLAICPHMGGDLSKANYDAKASTISCCWHGYIFDAVSGNFKLNPNIAGMQLLRTPSEHFDPARKVNFHLQRLEVAVTDGWVSVDYTGDSREA